MNRFFMGALVLIALPAFAFEYDGDGDFTDRGVTSAFDRYRLVLPPVNLCETGEYSFFVGELPADAMFLDLEYLYPKDITRDEAYQINELISTEVVKLILDDLKKNESIYRYEGKLYESGYDESGKYWRRGFPGVVDDLYGKIVYRLGVSFHKGFFWQHHSAKKLNFVVVTPISSLSNCTANFVIHGGGWQ